MKNLDVAVILDPNDLSKSLLLRASRMPTKIKTLFQRCGTDERGSGPGIRYVLVLLADTVMPELSQLRKDDHGDFRADFEEKHPMLCRSKAQSENLVKQEEGEDTSE